MFEDTTATNNIETLAIAVAIEDEAISNLAAELIKRKAAQEQSKTDLSMMITASGQRSAPLTCGLTITTKTVIKYFKAAGLEDEDLFAWLSSHELEHIIKPVVNYNTLNRSLADWTDIPGNELPEIFNRSATPGVTMGGKTKFLAGRRA